MAKRLCEEMLCTAEHNPGGTMDKTLQRLGEVDIIPPPGPSKFVAPQTVMYHLDGTRAHPQLQSGLSRIHVQCPAATSWQSTALASS